MEKRFAIDMIDENTFLEMIPSVKTSFFYFLLRAIDFYIKSIINILILDICFTSKILKNMRYLVNYQLNL